MTTILAEAGMFSTNHFIIIVFAVFVVFLSIYLIKKLKPSIRQMLIFMSFFALAMELLKIFARILPAYNDANEFIGYYYPSTHLPFHLCSIMAFIIWYLCLFNKNKKVEHAILAFMYPTCFFGGFFAILIPTYGADFANIEIYEYFLYHIGMVVLGLYVPISKQVKLGKKEWLSTMAIISVFFFLSIYTNSIVGPEMHPNFMYSSNPPMANLPYLNYHPFGDETKIGWVFYLIKLMFLGLVLITAFFVPFMVKERKESKEARVAGNLQVQFLNKD